MIFILSKIFIRNLCVCIYYNYISLTAFYYIKRKLLLTNYIKHENEEEDEKVL